MKKFAILMCDILEMKYHPLFENFLKLSGEEVQVESFHVCHGEYPVDLESFDVAIITGSPHSVYEELEW